jgi:hypothetical protein
MASKSDLINDAVAFRDLLYKAATSGAFNEAERDGFTRLHDFYQDRLEAFKERPRFGEVSDYYDNALHWAAKGSAAVPGCLSGDAASQQPVYDAANQGGDALDAVTNEPAKGGFLSFRGSLLTTKAVDAPAPIANAVPAAGGGAAGPVAFGVPPQAPPGADPAAPSGPVPPPKKSAADPSWFAKLMTMFPAEAVTAYLTGSQYFNGGSIWLVVLTLVAVIVVRTVALMSPEGKPNLLAVGVAGISFLLWVGATADASLAAQVQSVIGDHSDPTAFAKSLQKGASFVILLWTWVVPALIKVNPDA